MPSKNAEEIAVRIDAALAAGTVPWAKPWIAGAHAAKNLKSKKPYRGINALLLAFAEQPGEWWVTYKQATELGGQVRKGEKGSRVFFWKEWCPQTKGGDTRNCKVPEHQANPKQHHPFIMRGYTVFNAETQVDGLESKIPPRATVTPRTGDALAIGLAMVDRLRSYELAAGAQEGGDQAFYDPIADGITMPPTATFYDGERYYWAALHELTHSTGHKDRLDRFKAGTVFGDKDYAREELVAEIGSAIAALELGFQPDIEQSAAYIDHWRKALADDPELVTVAAQRASKAVDLLFSPEEEK